ncbi:hypothetical protein [Cellulosimicrobium sp. 4261]|uniref:hypothetical protein n=1 Tax=Cellulosimicrobium sp. 4261 TaxID=3156458 RepID=UPI003391C01B
MTAAFSWVDPAALVLSVASLAVTIAIFALGRRLTFRQRRERVRELVPEVEPYARPLEHTDDLDLSEPELGSDHRCSRRR